MADRLWRSYLDAIDSLTGLEDERQRRYRAADEEHTRAANRFANEQGAVERQWRQLADQATRSKATGDELMRRFRLTAAAAPEFTRESAGPALAEADRTITWCTQAAHWVAGYQQRAREHPAAPAPEPAPPTPAPAPPQPKAKAGCGAGAAAMLVALLAAPTIAVLKLIGVI